MDLAATLSQALDMYGLPAVFAIMLLKEIGVPVPVPSDLIILGGAARAAQGKESVALVFLVILLPMVIGGIVQYALVRGPARQFIYRVGPHIGLPAARLDKMMESIRRGGIAAVALGLTTPGVRIATVPASGLARLAPRVFVPGLIAGSAFFLAWHFVLGFAGGLLLALAGNSTPLLVALLVAVLAGGALGWFIIHRRRAQTGKHAPATVAETYGAWAHAVCPACLAVAVVHEAQREAGRSPFPID
ncbi:MAG: hypothetical protein HZB53_21970 [Chloroflexi bacterium]|nr:hypothetical protein [Chloroflexota bacterium]